jgi:hypothetical protein
MVFCTIEGTGDTGAATVDGGIGSGTDVELGKCIELDVQPVRRSGSFALCLHSGRLVCISNLNVGWGGMGD